MHFRQFLELQDRAVPQPIDPHHNLTQTGKYFDKFFGDVSRGDFGRSSVAFQPVLSMQGYEPFHDEVMQHTGHFDDHIAKSIPTYRESQVRKGQAIAGLPSDGTPLQMLDIGGSEGSFAKAITSYSRGRIHTTVLDPNRDMHKFFQSKSTVPNSRFDPRAFHQGWTEDDGSVVEALSADSSPDRYDVIHEAMVFQFINNQRAGQITQVKRLLKPGGLFVTEEKLVTSPDDWKRNELFKDQNYKNVYYSPHDLAAKQKVVGFQQDEKETKAVGMVDNMVSVEDFEKILLEKFREVWQYWDSGNFKGYCASDDAAKVRHFIQAAGNMNNKYSTTEVPRRVEPRGANMPSFAEWLQENRVESERPAEEKLLRLLVTDFNKFSRMSRQHIRDKHAPSLIQRAAEMGITLAPHELEDLLTKVLGTEVKLPEFDIDVYHHHM